jgi:glycine oxidase
VTRHVIQRLVHFLQGVSSKTDQSWERFLPALKIDVVKHSEVAIVGGGIIGLSLALELAEAGKKVTVFERGEVMQESSWAAAGMLAAADPENPVALRPLSEWSARLYPQFLERVQRLSGLNVPLRTTCALQGTDHLPGNLSPLSDASLQALVPDLQTGRRSFFALEEASLDPRDLCQALPKAVRVAGAVIQEQCPVHNVSEHDDSVAFDAGEEPWTANLLIYTAGAWSGELADIPVMPRKGQILEAHHPGPEALEVVLRTPEIYLVPRGEGRIVIGATVEEAGFDRQLRATATEKILTTAATLWPPIKRARVTAQWTGLRPATPDELPLIGPISAKRWIAAGHFRNGILLAPGTARLVRQMILGEKTEIDPGVFRCDRLATPSVSS